MALTWHEMSDAARRPATDRPSPLRDRHALRLTACANGWLLLGNGLLLVLLLSTGCARDYRRHVATTGHGKPANYPHGLCSGYFPTCWRRWPGECMSCPVDMGVIVPGESLPPGERSGASKTEMPLPPYEPRPDDGLDRGDSSDAPLPTNPDSRQIPDRDDAAREAPPPDNGSGAVKSRAKGSLVLSDRRPRLDCPANKAPATMVVKQKTLSKPAREVAPPPRKVPVRGQRDAAKVEPRRPEAGAVLSKAQDPVVRLGPSRRELESFDATDITAGKPRPGRASLNTPPGRSDGTASHVGPSTSVAGLRDLKSPAKSPVVRFGRAPSPPHKMEMKVLTPKKMQPRMTSLNTPPGQSDGAPSNVGSPASAEGLSDFKSPAQSAVAAAARLERLGKGANDVEATAHLTDKPWGKPAGKQKPFAGEKRAPESVANAPSPKAKETASSIKLNLKKLFGRFHSEQQDEAASPAVFITDGPGAAGGSGDGRRGQ